jgi:hypothetical protein
MDYLFCFLLRSNLFEGKRQYALGCLTLGNENILEEFSIWFGRGVLHGFKNIMKGPNGGEGKKRQEGHHALQRKMLTIIITNQ